MSEFIKAGEAIRNVVVSLEQRRTAHQQNKRDVASGGLTERMLKDSIVRLDDLQRARGHLIAAWKIFVAHSENVERARTIASQDFIDIIHQPVTEQK